MSGHPGVIGVTTGPPAPASLGPRELSPGLEDAARRTGDRPPAGPQGGIRGGREGAAGEHLGGGQMSVTPQPEGAEVPQAPPIPPGVDPNVPSPARLYD